MKWVEPRLRAGRAGARAATPAWPASGLLLPVPRARSCRQAPGQRIGSGYRQRGIRKVRPFGAFGTAQKHDPVAPLPQRLRPRQPVDVERAIPSASMRAVWSSAVTFNGCSASATAPRRRTRRARMARLAWSKTISWRSRCGRKIAFRFRRGSAGGEPDAALRSGAGDLGNGEKRLARQRRCRIDIDAAAIGQKKRATRAAILRDAVGIGESQNRADGYATISLVRAGTLSAPLPSTALSAPLPLAATGRGWCGGERQPGVALALHHIGPSSRHRYCARAGPEPSRRNPSMRCPRSTSLPPSPGSVRAADLGGKFGLAHASAVDHHASQSRRQRQIAQPPSLLREASVGVIAPSSPSNAFASASAGAGGGSRKASVSGSATPQ